MTGCGMNDNGQTGRGPGGSYHFNSEHYYRDDVSHHVLSDTTCDVSELMALVTSGNWTFELPERA